MPHEKDVLLIKETCLLQTFLQSSAVDVDIRWHFQILSTHFASLIYWRSLMFCVLQTFCWKTDAKVKKCSTLIIIQVWWILQSHSGSPEECWASVRSGKWGSWQSCCTLLQHLKKKKNTTACNHMQWCATVFYQCGYSHSHCGGSSSSTFNSVLRGKLLAVVFEVQHDLCSLLNTVGLSDLKHSRAEEDNDRERLSITFSYSHFTDVCTNALFVHQ